MASDSGNKIDYWIELLNKPALRKIGGGFDLMLSMAANISVVFLLLLSIFVGLQVIARYLFGLHIPGLFDLSSYSLILMTFLAAAYTLREGKHISVDIVSFHFPKRANHLVSITMYAGGLIFLAIFSFHSARWVHDSFSIGLMTVSETPIPKGILILSMLIGSLFLFIQISRMLVGRIGALLANKEPTQPRNTMVSDYSYAYPLVFIVAAILGIILFIKVNAVIGLAVLALAFLFSGIPVFLALGMLGTIGLYLLLGKGALRQLPMYAYQAVDSFPLTCLPLYIMGGMLFERGKMVQRVYAFFRCITGTSITAPLVTAVLIGGFFCACVGSSVATHAIISAVVLPMLLSEGYKKTLSSGLIGGVAVGTVIPPSIGYVVYGVITGESIGRLFIGGIIPGAILLSTYLIYIFALKSVDPKLLFEEGKAPTRQSPRQFDGKSFWPSLRDASWGLFIPVIVIGGIYAGVFTPTEAAGVLVVYTVIVTMFVLKTVDWRQLWRLGLDSLMVSAMILMIIVCARMFGSVITQMRIADEFVKFGQSVGLSGLSVLLFISLGLLVVGLFLDSASILIIFVPVLYPLAKGVGIDPIWFGVYFIIMTEIGLLTPPVGLNLYVIQSISGLPMETIAKGAIPFIALMLLTVVILYLFPSAVTWLPNTMMN